MAAPYSTGLSGCAKKRSDQVEACCRGRGVVYLNATPFWAFMPRPETQELTGRLLRRVVGYDGVMPAPEGLKRVLRSLWWDNFTTEDTVRGILKQVYPIR